MARERAHSHTRLPAVIGGMVDRFASRVRGRKVLTANPSSDRALLERQRVAFARTAGILKDVDIPDWETPEKSSAWVRKQRGLDSRATDDKLASHSTS